MHHWNSLASREIGRGRGEDLEIVPEVHGVLMDMALIFLGESSDMCFNTITAVILIESNL